MGTKNRRAARELALNVLYQIDVAKLPVDEALDTAIENTALEDPAQEFARELVGGTLANIKAIDKKLAELSVGWEPQRQPAVDRNILRMAMFEIIYLDYIPHSVSINEAVELAKKFGSDESSRFVNGVLGTLVRQIAPVKEEEIVSTDT